MFYMSLNAIKKFIVRDFPKKKKCSFNFNLNLYHDIQWFLKYKYMYLYVGLKFNLAILSDIKVPSIRLPICLFSSMISK